MTDHKQIASALDTPATPGWRDASWVDRFPRLSLVERDRRLRLARQVMDDAQVECLILASPSQAHDFLGHYFANEAKPAVVIPRDGDPIAFQDGVGSPSARHDLELSEQRFEDRWIADWRINEGARGIAKLLEDRDLADARIGCVGQSAIWPTCSYIVNGGAPWNQLPLTHAVSSLLPQAELTDIWPTLMPPISVKSAEEIEQFKRASHLAERAAQIYLETLRLGATEAEVMAEATFDVFRHGGYSPSGGTPFGGVYPRDHRLGKDDVVSSEIIVYSGASEAQACLTVCMGTPSRGMSALIDAAQAAYDLGRAAVRPGLTMLELQQVMAAPFQSIGAWSTPPLFHGLNPIFTQADVGHCYEPDLPGLRERFFTDVRGELPFKPVIAPDLPLAPGMTIHLEPNGQKGTDSVFIGTALLVTEDGAEEFGDTTRRVHVHDSH